MWDIIDSDNLIRLLIINLVEKVIFEAFWEFEYVFQRTNDICCIYGTVVTTPLNLIIFQNLLVFVWIG